MEHISPRVREKTYQDISAKKEQNMKKYGIGLILLSVLALIGCVVITTVFEPFDTLIKPPKVDGENLSIQLAFEEKVGTDYILKQPISGNRRSENFLALVVEKCQRVL